MLYDSSAFPNGDVNSNVNEYVCTVGSPVCICGKDAANVPTPSTRTSSVPPRAPDIVNVVAVKISLT